MSELLVARSFSGKTEPISIRKFMRDFVDSPEAWEAVIACWTFQKPVDFNDQANIVWVVMPYLASMEGQPAGHILPHCLKLRELRQGYQPPLALLAPPDEPPEEERPLAWWDVDVEAPTKTVGYCKVKARTKQQAMQEVSDRLAAGDDLLYREILETMERDSGFTDHIGGHDMKPIDASIRDDLH